MSEKTNVDWEKVVLSEQLELSVETINILKAINDKCVDDGKHRVSH